MNYSDIMSRGRNDQAPLWGTCYQEEETVIDPTPDRNRELAPIPVMG
jgi:hypothetical protein